jgi:glutamate synthase (ferredoxin)
MSGGVAYVLDEDGQFSNKRLNHEMVKVYPLVECDDSEILEVKELIVRHVDYTGSQRGQDILEDWETFSNKFIKILPEDYERVLLALKKAEERGLKGDDAAQAAFEENVAAGH